MRTRTIIVVAAATALMAAITAGPAGALSHYSARRGAVEASRPRSLRPPSIRTTPSGHRVSALRRQGRTFLDYIGFAPQLAEPTQCMSPTMSSEMPRPSDFNAPFGAAWLYWWPEFDKNVFATTYSSLPSVSTFYDGGPVIAANLANGQHYWQDATGNWHYLGLDAWAQETPPQTSALSNYGVRDWYEFVSANGSSLTGWINNGLRVYGYTGPRALGGVQVGYPDGAGSYGCVY